jgi:hypothetical protein
MEFVAKNDAIYIDDPSLNLANDNISNKLFYFSEISGNNFEINLYLDKSQITENLSFDCLFPSDSKIVNIYLSNKRYPFYINEGIIEDTTSISYVKQSFNIVVDNSNFNIYSHILRLKKKIN